MKRIALLGSFMLLISGMKGQDCGCDITLSNLKTNALNLIWGNNYDYSPGDTICVPAGTYRGLRFYDLVGTESEPIVIKNCGGQVVLNELQYSAISLQRSQYVHLTGTGDPQVPYGFYIGDTGSRSAAVYVENLSTDVEIDHIEVGYAGFAGIMAKTDPSCSRPETWRSNGFVLKNLNIHHNYIHHTGGEGIYIGFTGGNKIKSNRSCNGTPIFGHWLENVSVHHNRLEDIGWDGIQLNLVRKNAKVHDNTLIRYGTANKYYQDFAMSIGGGVYDIFNNSMINEAGDSGQGMQFISADSGTKVFNNLLVNPDFHGIFMHQRHEFENPAEGYYIANNTIISPEKSGMFYNTVITVTEDPDRKYKTQGSTPTHFVNNLILNPGNDYASGNTWKKNQESYFDFNKKATRDQLQSLVYTNYMGRDSTALHFENAGSNNYRPTAQSLALINQGSDLNGLQIDFDFDYNSRNTDAAYDIGAWEWINPSPNSLNPLNDPQFGGLASKTALYPNPAPGGIFQIEVPDAFGPETIISVIDLNGKEVHNGLLSNYIQNRSALPQGFYLIKLKDSKNVVSKKLIVR